MSTTRHFSLAQQRLNEIELDRIDSEVWKAERLLNELKVILCPPLPPNEYEKFFSKMLLNHSLKESNLVEFANYSKRYRKERVPRRLRFFS